MKMKLTPELSYIIGLWKEVRTKEGIGVHGTEERLSLFTKAVLESELTDSTKLLTTRQEEPEEDFENELAQEILSGKFTPGDIIDVNVEGDNLMFDKKSGQSVSAA